MIALPRRPGETGLRPGDETPRILSYFEYTWREGRDTKGISRSERYVPFEWIEGILTIRLLNEMTDPRDPDYPANRCIERLYYENSRDAFVWLALYPDQCWGEPHKGKGSIRAGGNRQGVMEIEDIVRSSMSSDQRYRVMTFKEYMG